MIVHRNRCTGRISPINHKRRQLLFSVSCSRRLQELLQFLFYNRNSKCNGVIVLMHLFCGIYAGLWYAQQQQYVTTLPTEIIATRYLSYIYNYNKWIDSSTIMLQGRRQQEEIHRNINKSNVLETPIDGWKTIFIYNGPTILLDKQQQYSSNDQQQQYSNKMSTPLRDGNADENSNSTSRITTATTRRINVYDDTILNIKANENQSPLLYYSQAHQDEVIIGLLSLQYNNRSTSTNDNAKHFFVDLAANDARLYSNTYALEQYFHWDGLCIEPNPMYWEKLSYYRTKCTVVGAVIGSPNYRNEEVYFRFNAGDHGGIANDGFNNGKRWQHDSVRRYTVPLIDLFVQYNVPKVIDYLSLDVEGAETYILQNFPFHLYTIKIITAERLRGPIRTYLKDHGYIFVRKLTKWGESLWVHSNYTNDLDWTILQKYNFPI